MKLEWNSFHQQINSKTVNLWYLRVIRWRYYELIMIQFLWVSTHVCQYPCHSLGIYNLFSRHYKGHIAKNQSVMLQVFLIRSQVSHSSPLTAHNSSQLTKNYQRSRSWGSYSEFQTYISAQQVRNQWPWSTRWKMHLLLWCRTNFLQLDFVFIFHQRWLVVINKHFNMIKKQVYT